ncbi:MAG: DUF711 family protein [Gammaproteobacteria bacterium]
MIKHRRSIAWVFALACLSVAVAQAQGYTKPRVRAITAFVRLDLDAYPKEIADTLAVLRSARARFNEQGYEVETLRIVTQPLPELIKAVSDDEALRFLKAFDDLSVKEDFTPHVGAAMLRDSDDLRSMRLLRTALSTLPNVHANVSIAGDDGIHWKVIHEAAELVRYVADHSPGSVGTMDFTTTAMVKPYAPFFPGAYHDGAGKSFSIGLEGASVVQEVFAKTHGDFSGSVSELTKQLTVHAKVAEAIGTQVASKTGWSFMGVDPTPAPRADVSIGKAIETYTGAHFGSNGTMTAALIITTAVKAVPVKQVGYSGLMIPVLEDGVLSQRWAEGKINTESLLAYSAVCGTGLDTIPFPGDITVAQLERVFSDVASLAWKWNKPLSARLQPMAGMKAGDRTNFKGVFLSNTALQPIP